MKKRIPRTGGILSIHSTRPASRAKPGPGFRIPTQISGKLCRLYRKVQPAGERNDDYSKICLVVYTDEFSCEKFNIILVLEFQNLDQQLFSA